jgi:hypothetical protein
MINIYLYVPSLNDQQVYQIPNIYVMLDCISQNFALSKYHIW